LKESANQVIGSLEIKKTLIKYEGFKQRRRDSNPRNLAVQRFSRPPHSTALPLLFERFRVRDANVDFYTNPAKLQPGFS
jgi:hypothetical protein